MMAEIINFYMKIIKKESSTNFFLPPCCFVSTHFCTNLMNLGHVCNEKCDDNCNKHGSRSHKNVAKWSRKLVPGGDLFKCDKIFFPDNVSGIHWVLFVAYPKLKRVISYDSYGSKHVKIMNNLVWCLEKEWAVNGSNGSRPSKWEKLKPPDDNPKQINGE